MRKSWLIVLLLILAGCTRNAAREFGEWAFSDRSEPRFEIDAVRPVFNCANVPDPRYPCAGIGPEGFMRDLVVKPFANKHYIDMYSESKKAGNRLWFTWFSMQGGCGLGNRNFVREAQPNTAAYPYYTANKSGTITRSADQDPKYDRYQKPIYPLGDCKTGIDMSAGQPVRAKLQLWAPSKFGDDLTIPVIASATGKFKTGCRVEKRNNLTWQVCSTALRLKVWDKSDRMYVEQERQKEVWIARLGKAGFFLQLTVTYRDPIFHYPGWYAERQANISEVIDTITLETLPYPPVVPRQQPSEKEKEKI